MKKKPGFDISEYKSCANCKNSREIIQDRILLCRKKGIVSFDGLCRKFDIDLLSINPKKVRTLSSALSDEDFSI
ncbi:MAG: hypothetical protein Q8882_03080 [Bacillota bacterium]|nr:hypothetical protein [Bacillota bacterium]